MPDPVENTYELLGRVRTAVDAVIVGQPTMVDQLMVSFVAGGHALIHGTPGLGKSAAVRALASAFTLRFGRIRGTADLAPADVIGTTTIMEGERGARRVEFTPGSLFSQVLYVDEITRIPPRTQSVLLDAMEDGEVLASGIRRPTEAPFVLVASENPEAIDAGAPLYESQRDRFLLSIDVPRPDPVSTVAVLSRTTGPTPPLPNAVAKPTSLLVARALSRSVAVRPRLFEWVTDMMRALDPHEPEAHARAREAVRIAPSVRGAQAVIMAAKAAALIRGSMNVEFADIERVVRPALRHRLLLTPEALHHGMTADVVLDGILPRPASSRPPPPPEPESVVAEPKIPVESVEHTQRLASVIISTDT